MNTQTNTHNPITPAQREAYRAVPAMDIADTAIALDAFLAHRKCFEAHGETDLATAAQRAWWVDAALLAAEPVASRDAARQKLEALQPAADGRNWTMAAPELRSLKAMVAAAVAVEQDRWSAGTEAEDPSSNLTFMERVRRDIMAMEQRGNNAALVIAPMLSWQADLYESLTTPATMVEALQSVSIVASHRATLQASGDAAGAAGAATNLRYAGLKLAAVTATSRRSLKRKARVLAAYRTLWADRPLDLAMIEAAVVADAAAMALEPERRAQLLQTLRAQP